MDDLYDELGIKDKFFDIALNYPKLSDGSNYLMTWQGNVEYFWYHKDMFEKAGITETPQTLEDLLDVCKKLKDAGMTPISAGNYDMIMRYPAFKAFRLEGNDFIDNARMGKEKFNSETGIATAQYTQDIAQYFSEGWTSSDTYRTDGSVSESVVRQCYTPEHGIHRILQMMREILKMTFPCSNFL